MSRKRSERILPYVKPGRIIEFGCGEGATLSLLSEYFQGSTIVGLDVDRNSLMKARNLANIILVRGEASQQVFRPSVLDTVIFKFLLHEIYSFERNEGVKKALSNAYKVLKADGVLIIYDFLATRPQPVRMKIKSNSAKVNFMKFAEEFQPRKILYHVEKEWIILEKADCLEFLTKGNFHDWEVEKKEAHYYYTLDEFREHLTKAGFKVKSIVKYRFEEEIWKEKLKIVTVNFDNPESYVLIVAEKSE